jgi:uncharacterized protein (DUF1697 family)
MSSHAAFLRGMNLGKRRVTNEELEAAFEALGFKEVATFRASGNVTFLAGDGDPTEIAGRIEQGLAKTFGYAVPTFLRSAREVGAIAAHVPFGDPEGYATDGFLGKLQVGLLVRDPSPDAVEEVNAMDGDEDRVSVYGRELYWLPNGPMSDSNLDLKTVERRLGAMTIRTMGTIEQIAERLQPTTAA